jgi:hypothetical protein
VLGGDLEHRFSLRSRRLVEVQGSSASDATSEHLKLMTLEARKYDTLVVH